MRRIISRLNEIMLNRWPEVWLTRLHLAIPIAVILFLAYRSAAFNVPLVTSLSTCYIFSILLLIPLLFLWIRFQWLRFLLPFQAGRLFRIFLFNGAILFSTMILVFTMPVEFQYRIKAVKKTRVLSRDEALLKLSAIYRDSAYYSRLPQESIYFGQDKVWRNFKDSVFADSAVDDKGLADPVFVASKEQETADFYGFQLHNPEGQPLRIYYDNIGTSMNRIRTEDDVSIQLDVVIVALLTFLLSIIFLYVLVSNKIYLLLGPPVSYLVIVLLFQLWTGLNMERLLNRHLGTVLEMGATTGCYFAIFYWIFRLGKKGQRTIVRTLALQTMGLGYILLAVSPAVVLSDMNEAFDGQTLAPIFLVFGCLVAGMFAFYFFIRTYLQYAFLPRRLK